MQDLRWNGSRWMSAIYPSIHRLSMWLLTKVVNAKALQVSSIEDPIGTMDAMMTSKGDVWVRRDMYNFRVKPHLHTGST